MAARTPAPGGGASAAFACALAAALVEMAAAFTPGRDDTARHARDLRTRAIQLAEDELHAYQPVLEARRLPREDPDRADRIKAAEAEASDSPLAIAAAAAEVAERASELARNGNRNLTGDAVAGALLAEAADQSAARLVAINLTDGPAVNAADVFSRRSQISRDAALR